MPENKEYIKSTDESGSVNISEDVVSTIATIAIGEVEGIAGLQSAQGVDLAGILDRKSRALRISVHGDTVTIDVYVRVRYGVKIPAVAAELQRSVEQSVSSMTGLKVGAVNVHVTALDFSEAKAE